MGHVLTFNSVGALICYHNGGQKKIRRRQDVAVVGHTQFYYPLGSSGPCPNSSLLDFDVFQLKTKCSDPNSFTEDDDELEELYNQVSPEYDFYHVTLVYGDERRSLSRRKSYPNYNNALQTQRPSYEMPDQLLNPCRPGKRNRNNFKCTNSFL